MKILGGAVAVTAAMIMMTGCGGTSADAGPSAAQQSRAAQAKVQEKAAQQRQAVAARRKARATAVYKECQEVAGPLDKELVALNSRLSVGLSFAKYSDQVGDLQVAYDSLIREAKRRGGISDPCISRVATPLERSLNAYVSAYNTWNDCINATYCTFDKGSTSLKKTQASWTKAGAASTKADDALIALEPSS